MSCVICNKKTFISIGKNNYCINCFNNLVRKDNIDCPIYINLKNINDKSYDFEINYYCFPTMIKFEAIDNDFIINKGYPFDSNIKDSLEDFINEIELTINDIQENISKKGTILIKDNIYQINNNNYSINDIQKLLSTYEGFKLNYSIEDSSEANLHSNEYLVKKYITQESLSDEFEFIVSNILNNNTLEDSKIELFKYLINEYIDKLYSYYKFNQREITSYMDKLILRLKHIETESTVINELVNKIEYIFHLRYLFRNDD